MVKIYKLNSLGSLGVGINKEMKAAGYVAGKEIYWEATQNGFILRLKPLIPVVYTKPSEPLETL